MRATTSLRRRGTGRVGRFRPNQAVLAAWLASGDVVGEAGAVRSWWNERGTGYDYPEAGGLWLAGACDRGTGFDCEEVQADKVSGWLSAGVNERGAAGRNGDLYLFDSAVVLNGLVAHALATGRDEQQGVIESLYRFIADSVPRRRAVLPAPVGSKRRWSVSFGAHQLKAVIALHRYADLTGTEEARAVAGLIVEAQLPLFEGSRFVVFEGADLTYLHASLYALEGLVYLDRRGFGEHLSILEPAARWLASVQGSDGSLPAYVEAGRCYGEARADAVAQAARLWLLLDPGLWREHVDAALSFLATLQSPRGGVLYSPGCQDVNTWASLFTLQALEWRRRGANGAELL